MSGEPLTMAPAAAARYNDVVALLRAGDTAVAAGNQSEAQRLYQEALALTQGWDAASSAPVWQQIRMVVNQLLGTLAESSGKLAAARRHYEEALRHAERLVGDESLAHANPTWHRDRAVVHDLLGNLAGSGDVPNFEEAQRHFEEALRIRQQLADTYPADPTWQAELATSYERLGVLQQNWGINQQKEAIAAHKEGDTETAEEYVAAAERHYESARSHYQNALTHYQNAQLPEQQLAAEDPAAEPVVSEEAARIDERLASLPPAGASLLPAPVQPRQAAVQPPASDQPASDQPAGSGTSQPAAAVPSSAGSPVAVGETTGREPVPPGAGPARLDDVLWDHIAVAGASGICQRVAGSVDDARKQVAAMALSPRQTGHRALSREVERFGREVSLEIGRCVSRAEALAEDILLVNADTMATEKAVAGLLSPERTAALGRSSLANVDGALATTSGEFADPGLLPSGAGGLASLLSESGSVAALLGDPAEPSSPGSVTTGVDGKEPLEWLQGAGAFGRDGRL